MSGDGLEGRSVEIRVPTFRRPDMLREALASLERQSHTRWNAVVLDDCPESSARAVVESLGSARVRYRWNQRRLGAAGNIDQAFRKEAFLGGSGYFGILEDDNLLEEGFLAAAIGAIEERGVEVALVNQSIRIRKGGAWSSTGLTTRGGVYAGEKLGPAQLRAGGLISEGISNGGLLWSGRCVSDLEVGPTITNSVLQERMRTWKIDEPVAYIETPMGVWRDTEHAVAPRTAGMTRMVRWARLARGCQSLARRVFELHPEAVRELYERLVREGDARAEQLLESLARAGCRATWGRGIGARRLRSLRWKGSLLRWAVTDPTAKVWSEA